MTALWKPTPESIARSQMERFRRFVCQREPAVLPDYRALYRWSIETRDKFWSALWDFAGIVGDRGNVVARDLDKMPGTRWFPDARINFAENLLRRLDTRPAILYRDERGRSDAITHAALATKVDRVAASLVERGLVAGDRVAAVLPNRIDTVIAMLACAKLGAVWSSCSPDFGASAIVDRFGQIEPTILFGCDGYAYGGRWFDCLPRLAEVKARLPTVKTTILVQVRDEAVPVLPDRGANDALAGAVSFNELLRSSVRATPFARLPFDAPLYVMFSSGTTGAPKCIVHGIGGTLLQHQKEHLLHCDVHGGERLLFFTTTGWMMWNWLVSALASGATVCLYDGSTFHPDMGALLRYVEEEAIHHLGVSPGYLSTMAKHGYDAGAHHDLGSLRSILSTGSPLAAETHRWAYDRVAPVRISSITGGTDIMGCFALGVPTLPVWAGEIQAPGLGMAIDFFDDTGLPLARGHAHSPVESKKGELVCTRSFPSMPIGFWNDPSNARYHAAYFERYPGVWHHGDFGEFTATGGVIIHGRSDAVLNRGGVRIGTAEIYREVEGMPGVLECVAVAQRWENDVRLVLFVVLKPGQVFDEELVREIRQRIREGASPRHVPDLVVPVADIPKTRSGKLVEIAVRNVIEGEPVGNVGALANPESLQLFKDLPELE